MAYLDGFTSYEGNAIQWKVIYDNGATTFVFAPTQAEALRRFQAKYPNKTVKEIVRC